ncbi:hypothetical protein [Vagococcus intermedius]|uniref:Uncharacterized protein n=1 Tax=Vagococcus intermedius TaxID=2991418 RepID=A0AAF0CV97_9ENTE|nr:hypothetical protein [Vagococcus intermedius]WEG73497.1 hypothetical protein OL234_00895 [Vagococcus intermedius]WEG75579.1 hypothetical protein OL235_00900 [Vagococcus intermedius]
MKIQTLLSLCLTGFLLVGCGDKKQETTKSSKSSTVHTTYSSKKDDSFQKESTTMSTTSNESIDIKKELTEEQALEIASKVADDFKKQILGTFKDSDTSTSWGSTITIQFNEDNSIVMTETDNSFQKTDLTYKGTCSIEIYPIASTLMKKIEDSSFEEEQEIINKSLTISTYKDYTNFLEKKELSYIPVEIDTTINGFKGSEIDNEKFSSQAEFIYENFKLEMSYNTKLFKSAKQRFLTKQ